MIRALPGSSLTGPHPAPPVRACSHAGSAVAADPVPGAVAGSGGAHSPASGVLARTDRVTSSLRLWAADKPGNVHLHVPERRLPARELLGKYLDLLR
ncbi:hypothetical protein [Streptomyces sp. NPDC051098]|uniref:hypothetical protein n=1 Tax=Streptomyces sp. NPDC051098 TaxID=3155411 RepID=UPI00342C9608